MYVCWWELTTRLSVMKSSSRIFWMSLLFAKTFFSAAGETGCWVPTHEVWHHTWAKRTHPGCVDSRPGVWWPSEVCFWNTNSLAHIWPFSDTPPTLWCLWFLLGPGHVESLFISLSPHQLIPPTWTENGGVNTDTQGRASQQVMLQTSGQSLGDPLPRLWDVSSGGHGRDNQKYPQHSSNHL